MTADALPAPARPGFLARRRRHMRLLTLPAMIVIVAVIIFPWLFTLWMSAFDWKIGTVAHFVGIDNYVKLATNQRFIESIVHTFYFTALAVVLPLFLGTAAALVFHREFPFRGVLRAVFTMPMMATPVAIALVWTMMFHPQQGVLNYLLSLVGHSTAAVGLFADAGDSEPRAGRDLALDAAGDADRAGRPRLAADGAVRVGADGRRQRMAAVPLHHVSAGRAVSSSSPR